MSGLLLMLQGSPGTTDEKAKGGRALGGSNFEALAASKSKSTATSDGSLAPGAGTVSAHLLWARKLPLQRPAIPWAGQGRLAFMEGQVLSKVAQLPALPCRQSP